ncbi:tryptophanase [Clostridium pascui]|uniref:beta-eliminating lyase-related protein n=1 Tax=Clostridium pascui TaxID=46609 RepID=UPI00195D97D7|nr:beta-eliminating lyase-related protein [Clostridium pascui]MBM7870702.1 tryptophanase [Clostridium pascui]
MKSAVSDCYEPKYGEPLRIIPKAQREQAIKRAGYNTFLLKPKEVYIDLLIHNKINNNKLKKDITNSQSSNCNYDKYRLEQVEYLAERLEKASIPIISSGGGHAVFLDAKRFLPNIPQSQFPAQALAAALYVDSGVRGMERGTVFAGRDSTTGKERTPKLELVKLTIPQGIYTYAHLDYVAEAIMSLYKKRNEIKGFKWEYEPKILRFFTGRFSVIE